MTLEGATPLRKESGRRKEDTGEGKPAVEWTWEGNDESDSAMGRGWATLKDDEMEGEILFHEIAVVITIDLQRGCGELVGVARMAGILLSQVTNLLV